MKHHGQTNQDFPPKPEFVDRMNSLLKDEADREAFWEIQNVRIKTSIRCNTLKITPEKLKARLEKKGWKIEQPFKEHPEIMIIKNRLLPGELGKAKEHLLGYYYVQEISSMMPILCLNLTPEDFFLDLCSSPGSKTTQAAAIMKNRGMIIANERSFSRIPPLGINLQKCSVSNAIITQKTGEFVCKKLAEIDLVPNKILADVTCSKEGIIRSDKKTLVMWNLKAIDRISREQKVLAEHAIELLNPEGEMVYSTCTHAPEENEEVIQHLLDKYDIELLPVKIPLKTRPGLSEWQGKKFSPEIKHCARIYPQDNDTEGFFICKIKKLSNKLKNPAGNQATK